MFVEKIRQMRDYCQNLDEHKCKKLRVNQFGNMLCVIMDKGLLDSSAETEKVVAAIEAAYDLLQLIVDLDDDSKHHYRQYNRKYNKALETVRKYYHLEPVGSIQGRCMASGIAIGTAVGTVLMTVISPAMMSIGIGAGIAIGVATGQQKEREAQEQGRLF